MKKILLAGIISLLSVNINAQNQLSTNELTSLYKTSAASVVSIHDPSVVFRNGQFVVWGSHLGVAKSSDLVTWTPLSAGSSTFRKLATQGAETGTNCTFSDAFNTQQVTRVKNYKGEEIDFPNFDAEAYSCRYAVDKQTWVNGNMWAPDIIYNEQMKKWCMYLSLNGDNWSSIIILLTSNTSTGPFIYQGPVVMGGFTSQTYSVKDSNGKEVRKEAAPKIGETDYTIATGETSLPARYKQSDNGKYWPNCIDPCVFYDEEGELWMSYGSWSGGIFLLKLDKETGLRDYTYTYESDYATKGASGVSDPYFGKKIAGGYYVSGEGSYIQHIGDYYYLFMSYGFYSPDGGYEMRVFRSEKPDGPYKDASGNVATYDKYQMNYGTNAATNRGMKLMGSYNGWGNQNVGVCAQGHNSACADAKGRNFVVYHTKFNDGTAGHQVRVHQLFLNEKGWIVAAPFAYAGETTTDEDIASRCPWSTEMIVGDYHLLVHNYKMDYANMQEQTPVTVTLTADGKVKGDMTGTWTVKEGSAYLTLKLGSTTYYGVLCQQHVSGATKSNMQTTTLQALAFTAQSNSGVSVWGYKLEEQYAVAYNYVNNKTIFASTVKTGTAYSSNIDLMFAPEENATLTWTSSQPTIIDETGKYNPAGLDEVQNVTLTARLACGDYFWEQSYDVKAQKDVQPSGDYLSGLVAYYDFDTTPCYNAYNQEQRTSFATTGTKPTLVDDYARFGKVLHQSFGAQGSNGYTRMTNPLYEAADLKGMTISMWVKRSDLNQWDALWGFFGSLSATAKGSRFFLTGNSYVCFNDNDGTWFDINHPDNDANDVNIPVGKWALVTVTVGESNGVRIYVNGTNKTPKSVAASNGKTKVKEIPYADLLKNITSLKYLYLGSGSFWGSADCYIDELMVYNRELSNSDVSALKTMNNRVHDFTIGEGGTGIENIENEQAEMQHVSGIYDLSGRRINTTSRQGINITPRHGSDTNPRNGVNTVPRHGIYIVNGKKMVR